MSILDGKRIMHIDTSGKLYEKKDTGIAFKIVKTGQHKGLALSNKLKRELDRDLEANQDYARLYAICIYYLIKDNLNDFDLLIVCDDENFIYVKLYLDILFLDSVEYKNKNIMSIGELREVTGNKNLRSYADGISNVYRKKALRSIQRQQRGIQLNMANISYYLITEVWQKIEKNVKKT